ncbi:hypothetical protein CHRYSEOSP005_14920 [Chryseobacterium sp. Alg-005]|uniref:hypothetical protein n=1 Tax=Chryseobacterium sp. Alg-005 TaxID=3159516 RepID=UPI003555BB53
MDVLEWIEKAKSFNSNSLLNKFTVRIITDEKIIDLQRQQWRAGKDSKGRIIGYYKKSTEEISNGRKIQGDPYDLFDTGDFWQRTYLIGVIRGDNIDFEFNSAGQNKKSLFQTIQFHGEITNPEEIFGLMEFYKSKFIELIEPKFIKELEKYYSNV